MNGSEMALYKILWILTPTLLTVVGFFICKNIARIEGDIKKNTHRINKMDTRVDKIDGRLIRIETRCKTFHGNSIGVNDAD